MNFCMKKEKEYIIKHNEGGQMHLFVEKTNYGKTLSYYKLEDNSLIRYDGKTKECTFTKFKDECIMVHRFDAGESWVNITDQNYNTIQYDLTKKVKEVKVKNKNITSFILDKTKLDYIIDINRINNLKNQ